MAYQLIIKLPPGTPVNRGNVIGQDKLAFSFASAKLRAKLEQFIAQGKTGRYFTEYELGYKDKDQNAIIPMLFCSLENLFKIYFWLLYLIVPF